MKTKNIYKNEDYLLSFFFGLVIRRLRKDKGYTTSELAEKINVSQQQMSRYERGVNKINVDTIAEISFALEIPIEVFFKHAIAEAKYNLIRKNKNLSKKEKLLFFNELYFY
ncbi:helix-turn-helix transcriptional regulator [Providencia alcalifaciens]|uniref:helix-turn-helix domain-containing protein n=1 Tax=Providencia sp. wls1921 TaxID=2675153 RepID=UPI0012B6580E|nr:helix-turn-helix transcriptional regulator [Providencia sp. wls1921]MTC42408.1 helix-turn-helix domain-containing protein [Providencia sp. wls1921]HEQ1858329.1 helix-turn-helix transcriptional regulator [Providencia alcalifaciens]